jgi:hypothetical protein
MDGTPSSRFGLSLLGAFERRQRARRALDLSSIRLQVDRLLLGIELRQAV